MNNVLSIAELSVAETDHLRPTGCIWRQQFLQAVLTCGMTGWLIGSIRKRYDGRVATNIHATLFEHRRAVSEFNPYQQWLGIRGRAKPTYYQLLGIKPHETNVKRIRQQGERLVARLRDLDVGGRECLRQQLLDRIQRAVDCLADDQRKAEYDRQLREAVKNKRHEGIARPMQGSRQPATSALLASRDRLVAAAERFASDRSADVADVWPTAANSPHIDLNEKRRVRAMYRNTWRQRQRTNLLLAAGLIFLASMLTAVCQLAGTNGWLKLSQPRPPVESAAATSTSPRTTTVGPRTTTVGPRTTPLGPSPPTRGDRPREISPRSITRPAATASGRDAPPPTTITREELDKLSALWKQARACLARRDTRAARELLAQAKVFAKRGEDQAKHRRLSLLAEYVDEYWQASLEGSARLAAGEEIMIDEMRLIVVENNSASLVLRGNGRNRTYQRTQLPLAIATAMADRVLDPAAGSTLVFRGAMMAVTAGYAPEDAEQLWREAATLGVDLADLPRVLHDDYDPRLD